MTLKSRLAKIEKRQTAARPVEIQVWLSGDGYCERMGVAGGVVERLTDAEFEAATRGQKVYHARPKDLEGHEDDND